MLSLWCGAGTGSGDQCPYLRYSGHYQWDPDDLYLKSFWSHHNLFDADRSSEIVRYARDGPEFKSWTIQFHCLRATNRVMGNKGWREHSARWEITQQARIGLALKPDVKSGYRSAGWARRVEILPRLKFRDESQLNPRKPQVREYHCAGTRLWFFRRDVRSSDCEGWTRATKNPRLAGYRETRIWGQ